MFDNLLIPYKKNIRYITRFFPVTESHKIILWLAMRKPKNRQFH